MLDSEKQTRQNKESAEKFWSSVRPLSTLSDSHYKLGLYYQQQRKYEKAIGEFSKAVRNNAGYCKAYNGIAMCLDAMHRCTKAHDVYMQALQCAPTQAWVYNNFACSSILCGDYEKGISLLLEASELSRDNSRIQNNLQLARSLHQQYMEQVFVEEEVVTIREEQIPAASVESGEGVAIQTDPAPQLPKKLAPEGLQEDERGAGMLTGHSEKPQPTRKNLVVEKLKIIESTSKVESLAVMVNGAVEISNGNGVTGMAGRIAKYFRGDGYKVIRITNAEHFHFSNSTIFYRDGYEPLANRLAVTLPGRQKLQLVDSFDRSAIRVKILLGRDLAGKVFPQNYAVNSDTSL